MQWPLGFDRQIVGDSKRAEQQKLPEYNNKQDGGRRSKERKGLMYARPR